MPSHNLVQPPSPSQNSPSFLNSPIVSTLGGKPLAQILLPTGGNISNMGKKLPTGPPTMKFPCPNTTMVVLPYGQGGSS